jgi:polysaccharide biosynthesis protein PelF
LKVCIISEGSYPIVFGGLSEWAHMLIKSLKDVQFDIFCITPSKDKITPVYEKLPNVNKVIIKPLIREHSPNHSRNPSNQASSRLAHFLKETGTGTISELENLVKSLGKYPVGKQWMNSNEYWKYLVESYQQSYPEGPFVDYFWTVFGLNSIMLDSMNFIHEIPEADVYHSLSTGFAGFAGSIAKATHHKPMIITEQGLYLVERRAELARQQVSKIYKSQLMKFTESMVKTSYASADKIVPPCHSHIAIETGLGADVNKITVINNGIELDRFTPQYRDGGQLVVGCFARVVPIKGILNLISAAKIVLEKCPADFVVLGDIQDEEYYKECQNLVAKMGLGDHFKFMGHSKPEEWYHKVDVFTLPSISEGVPYALLEAMSSGLPSVCTAVGGVPEIISDGAGFVVPPNNPGALAEKLCILLGNRELRLKIGRHAAKVALTKYGIEEMAERFRNLYEEVVK